MRPDLFAQHQHCHSELLGSDAFTKNNSDRLWLEVYQADIER